EKALLAGFDKALAQLLEHRRREGEQLRLLIEQRLQSIETISKQVRAALPAIIARQKQKLLDRFAELQLAVDNERIEQEIVLLAQKMDVDEELDRLMTHIDEVRNTLANGGPCGRRLDFLMQELNREANTLGSKSINSETSQAAVDLKVAIEQMREQVQNIE
ncbi:MAG TPA: YicC/YloC family endoribonuclease, partial [Pseudomonadales bacterium]